MSDDALGNALLSIARNSVEQHFGKPRRILPEHPALNAPGASFVTITQNKALRGCIGSLNAYRPLGEDVAENALSAALHDPRFPALSPDELAISCFEVSLLEPAVPLEFKDEAEALARLRPGVDGVILSCHGRRATFLPQVWESLPRPADFIRQLKLKAGLPADYWNATIQLSRYGVEKWKE